jgi:hypothetical protein
LSERLSSVRELLGAAHRIYQARAGIVEALVASTGLSREGVELGFEYLERDASESDLASLVAGVSEADHVHVILSANVFVAPLRALALARAAAPRVTVRPSDRDPWLARALLEGIDDPSLTMLGGRDAAALDADCIHVYGSDATISAVRTAARPGTTILGHGAGFGVVFLARTTEPEAAAAHIAVDIVAFDQRGCLSPRMVVVEGDVTRATRVAEAIHAELGAWADRVPRGRLHPDEVADARRWMDTVSFAGRGWVGRDHLVGLGPAGEAQPLPPPGRHVHVAATASLEHASALLAPFSPFIVAVGTDDPARAGLVSPAHARISPLGWMQRPPLDGPVDRRP